VIRRGKITATATGGTTPGVGSKYVLAGRKQAFSAAGGRGNCLKNPPFHHLVVLGLLSLLDSYSSL